MDYKEERDLLHLRRTGMSEEEISHLRQLRHQYWAERNQLESPAHTYHLQFVCGLATTHQLAEQAPPVSKDSMMGEDHPVRQVNEATGDVIATFREINQAVVDSLVALQDCSLRLAQSIFLNWMAMLTQQHESMQQQWE